MNQGNKKDLTPSQVRLLESMQRINFGRIEGLVVRGGEPVFNPPPIVARQIKLGRDNAPRPEMRLRDFVLKAEVRELLDHLQRIGDGVIRRVEIRHGLPCALTVEEDAA